MSLSCVRRDYPSEAMEIVCHCTKSGRMSRKLGIGEIHSKIHLKRGVRRQVDLFWKNEASRQFKQRATYRRSLKLDIVAICD